MDRLKRVRQSTYDGIMGDFSDLCNNTLSCLTDITVYSFLKRYDIIQKHAKANCHIVTESFEEYKEFFEGNSQYRQYQHIPVHERRHAMVAMEYGLTVEYGVMLLYRNKKHPNPIIGFLFFDLPNLGIMWPLPRLLEFLIEATSVDMCISEPDLLVKHNAKIALEKFNS